MRALLAIASGVLAWQLLKPRPVNRLAAPPVRIAQPGTVTDWEAELRRYLDIETAAKGYPMPEQPNPPQAKPAAPVALWKTPAAGQKYEQLFLSASAKYGLPPGLLSRIAYQESRYDPKAYNEKSKASGIMQIVTRWHPGIDPWNPDQAIPYAASYLARLHRLFKSWPKAIAAYNWGEGNLQRYAIDPYGAAWQNHLPAETAAYVRDVVRDTGVK